MNTHPLYESVSAGPPSPVDNGEAFDLADHLIRHPHDTFYVRVSGNSMQDARINDGDILIVDRSIEPQPSDIVVAQVDGGFTVKRFTREHGRLRLIPANADHKAIETSEDARICGVVTFSVHSL